LLLLLATRFKKAVKSSTHEVRRQQSNIVASCSRVWIHPRGHGLRQAGVEQQTLAAVSAATVAAALKARQVKRCSPLSFSVIVPSALPSSCGEGRCSSLEEG